MRSAKHVDLLHQLFGLLYPCGLRPLPLLDDLLAALLLPAELHHHGRQIVLAGLVEGRTHHRSGRRLRVPPVLGCQVHHLLVLQHVIHTVARKHQEQVLFRDRLHPNLGYTGDEGGGFFEAEVAEGPGHGQPHPGPPLPLGRGVPPHPPDAGYLPYQPPRPLDAGTLVSAVGLMVLTEPDGAAAAAEEGAAVTQVGHVSRQIARAVPAEHRQQGCRSGIHLLPLRKL
mmetsp:Transcript_17264/g.29037  ORF Transcript_17264/g.29037 Transcript_17264/m.29037 type:complete len:227 (+) Transcript_17264:164-844(+)